MEIKVYYAEYCSYCKNLKSYLNKHSIPYTAIDIKESEGAYKEFVALGGEAIPFTLILKNGEIVKKIHGFREAKFNEYLV